MAGEIRVKVKDSEGKDRWRPLGAILPTDVLQMDSNGEVIKTTGVMGRPRKIDAQGPPKPSPVTVVNTKSKKSSPSTTAVAVQKPSAVQKPPSPSHVMAPVAISTPTTLQELRAMQMAVCLDDSVYLQVQRGIENFDVFQALMQQLAEESAFLRALRDRAYLDGSPYLDLTIKRIKVLSTMADGWLKRAGQIKGGKGIDTASAAFRETLKFIFETFYASMEKSGIRSEQIKAVLNHLNKAMGPEWENELKQRLKGI